MARRVEVPTSHAGHELRAAGPSSFVLDGEIVIEIDGVLSFDQLPLRIQPAESRVRKLAAHAPATLLAFDLLVDARAQPDVPRVARPPSSPGGILQAVRRSRVRLSLERLLAATR